MYSFEKEHVQELYPGCKKIYGPHIRKSDSRAIMTLVGDEGLKYSAQLAKLRLEIKIGRILTIDETVDHVDEDRTNDHYDNLQLLSRSENCTKSALGNQNSLGYKQTDEQKRSGSKNGKAVLTDDQVLEFRIRFSEKQITKSEIIEQTQMCDKSVRNMLHGVTYSDVGYPCKPAKTGRPRAK